MNELEEEGGEGRERPKKLYAMENVGAGIDTCSDCGRNANGECICNKDKLVPVSMDRSAKPSEAEFFLQA